MTQRHVIAALAGAALAATGLLLGGGFASDQPVAEQVAQPTTSPTAAPPLVAEGEAVFGSTALVVLDLRTVGNAIVIDYSLTALGGSIVTAVPERFVLTAEDGSQHSASVSSPATRSARFEGAAGQVVAEIVMTEWRQRMYEEYDTELSLTEGLTLTDGTTVLVDRILDESVGALLYFKVTPGSNHGFGGQEFTGPWLVSAGIGWQDVLDVDRTGSSTGAPSLSVTVDPLPDPVPLHVVARPWVRSEETRVIYRNEPDA